MTVNVFVFDFLFFCVCVNLRIISDTMSGRKLKCIEICFHACITWTIIPIRLNDYIASHPGKQMEILLARVKALEEHAVFFFFFPVLLRIQKQFRTYTFLHVI